MPYRGMDKGLSNLLMLPAQLRRSGEYGIMKQSEEDMDSHDVLFYEHYAAAQSMKNAWTRLASTYGCMMIVLTPKTLTIKPHWHAIWLIRALHLDLYHEIPNAKIKGVIEIGKWLSYGKVELHFQAGEGKGQKIMLYMKKYREFVDKVSTVIRC